MEENVALDTSKQKQFVKSIKGIKKLIQKNDAEGVREKLSKSKVSGGKVQKKKRTPRGLVYLGHIPHGFYENEMTQYFKQFGMVTNVRVIRSKRTGNSKGFAFVEFKEPAVAEIVAETMNNYLMGKRLIKAAYIPPEKQKRANRKFWSRTFNPGSEGRLKSKKAYNANKDEQGDLKKAKKLISNVNKTKKKLRELGINYDFFTPVDVPESLLNLVSNDNKNTSTEDLQKKDKKVSNKGSREVKLDGDKKNTKGVNENADAKNKLSRKTVEVVQKEQKLKEKKLTNAGVKHIENFIKIKKESDSESNSSCNFDSDEFDRMLSNDNSSNDSESSNESLTDGDLEESENEDPPMLVPAPLVKTNKKLKNVETSVQLKREVFHKNAAKQRKSKFENNNIKKLNRKQLKKK